LKCHLLLESVLPEFEPYLPIFNFFTFCNIYFYRFSSIYFRLPNITALMHIQNQRSNSFTYSKSCGNLQASNNSHHLRDYLQVLFLNSSIPLYEPLIFLFLMCVASSLIKTILRGFSPQAKYTDRATPFVGEVSANFCG
jgi:hypothetical protein